MAKKRKSMPTKKEFISKFDVLKIFLFLVLFSIFFYIIFSDNRFIRYAFSAVYPEDIVVNCEAGGPYKKGASVLVYGNVTDSGVGAASSVVIRIKQGNSVLVSHNTNSDSDGVYYDTFPETLDVGSYKVNVTATISGLSNSCEDNLDIQFASTSGCQYRNIKINGLAVYSGTGSYISSGRVTIGIVEKAITNSTSFTNGRYYISLRECLDIGNRYTISVIIDDGTGRRGVNYYKFNVVY
jgi:hypothetical protein